MFQKKTIVVSRTNEGAYKLNMDECEPEIHYSFKEALSNVFWPMVMEQRKTLFPKRTRGTKTHIFCDLEVEKEGTHVVSIQTNWNGTSDGSSVEVSVYVTHAPNNRGSQLGSSY